MENRLHHLDVLKFLGVFCIFLAHVNPPSFLFQIRNFDVILMCMISIYIYLNYKKEKNLFIYLKKRFIR